MRRRCDAIVAAQAWDVSITDDEGHLCAVSRMTIAVRPPHR
jgi:acyl-coenzyme A thioesterase PaaI-like protein